MFSAVPSALCPVFILCAPGLIFGRTEGVGSRFHVLRAQTNFRRYRGRRVSFSCFAHSDSFLAVMWASVPVFMFCAPGLVFSGTEGVGSRFHVLRARTHFRRYRGRRVPFYVLHARTRFRPYGGRRVTFSCFARPDSFAAVTRATGLVFMFCAPGLVFIVNEGVGVPFSCFARPDSFAAVTRATGLVFMFCAAGLVFVANEGVESRFHVLCVRTRFRPYRGRQVPF
jgi:hypothetical protein